MNVAWDPKALAAAQLYAKEDREGVLTVFDATDALASDPRPPGSLSYGENLHRLHVGRYRVWYEIKDEIVEIAVFHLGRTGA
ncbi:type II toxin-antitoxin system RelE/ParE family toxin [Streptomyces sp. NBC_01808]|uniref:type II toxin-antitoxin system RelE family toxin n=1 Tax=Streptomyces sp. NBC_01808 TaxID=2975947 RepID=UPI002DDBD161|nr:type II toxin-antitoxin system RelE/ParE family toxin [Streptomyces sp. NBC_01808]WSA39702.1 type II toxin-antitoxin system RelE/ParE family toxin [Streptomyces sp. NBC_01808]